MTEVGKRSCYYCGVFLTEFTGFTGFLLNLGSEKKKYIISIKYKIAYKKI